MWGGDYDGFNGDMDPEPSYGGRNDGGRQGSSHHEPIYDRVLPEPKFSFASEEELVTSQVFQRHLGMSLAFKDKIIHELQEELLRINNG